MRFIRSIFGVIILGLFIWLLIIWAAPYSEGTGHEIEVCPPTVTPCATIGPPPTLPRPTIITVPKGTITLPRATVTVPVTKTVTKRIPGPVTTTTVTNTVVKKVPGPTVTQTRSIRVPIGQSGQERGTVPTVTVTATATQTQTKVVKDTETIEVTVPKAVGLSLGILLLGIALGALGIFMAYHYGYLRSEEKNVEDLEVFRDSLKE